MAQQSESAGPVHSSIPGFRPTAFAAWTAVCLLSAANLLSFFHRNLASLLAEPIRNEFGMSDMQVGLLIGPLFSASYLLAVFPIARLADRGSRNIVVGCCVLVWSLFTSLGLIARSFYTLALLRIGVGAAESGLAPSSLSLLADYFSARTLSRATGIFMSGIYLGGGLAMLGGGWLATVIDPMNTFSLSLLGSISGWKLIFFLAGLPGLLLGFVIMAIKDPRVPVTVGTKPRPHGHYDGLAMVLRSRPHIGLIGGFALMIFVGSATAAWIPTFLQRAYDWTLPEIGFRYGVIITVCGASSSILGGWLASSLRSNGRPNSHLVMLMVCFVCLVPTASLFPLMPSAEAALVLIGLMNMFAATSLGIGFSLLQEITAEHLRARISALNSVAANIIGGALGPVTVAFLSDHMFTSSEALSMALASTAAVGSIAASALLWFALGALWNRDEPKS